MGHPSFSQLGEDGTLWWIFEGQRHEYYVDIGCHDPLVYSNTALMHHASDWRGLNIDMDADAIAAFDKARPSDTNVVAAVGRRAETLEATLFPGSSALNYTGVPNPDYDHLPHTKRMVEMIPLATILDAHVPKSVPIDFLNIDAEGCDHEIFASNDWNRYRPTVIATETRRGDIIGAMATHPTYLFLRGLGYTLISHTVVTSIFWVHD